MRAKARGTAALEPSPVRSACFCPPPCVSILITCDSTCPPVPLISSYLSLLTHLHHLCVFCHHSSRFSFIRSSTCKNVSSPKTSCPEFSVFFFTLVMSFFLLLITSRPPLCIVLIGAVLILTMFIFLAAKICREVGR